MLNNLQHGNKQTRLTTLIANATKTNAHFQLEDLINIIAERQCDLMMMVDGDDENAHDDTLWKQSRSPKVEYSDDDDDADETTPLLQKAEPSSHNNNNNGQLSKIDEDTLAELLSRKCRINN